MNRETALRKALRCLRMAASSNPHEAATALRQARAIMDEHNLTEVDAYASEIHEADAATRCRGSIPPQSLMALIAVVRKGFRCESIVLRGSSDDGRASTVVRFFGAGSDAEIAAYAFAVLRRQLEADKAKHTSRIRKRANKDSRAEAFAIGWVMAVSNLFESADLSIEQRDTLRRAREIRFPDSTTTSGREIADKGASWRDRERGYDAGMRARLNQGLNESGQKRIESKGPTE